MEKNEIWEKALSLLSSKLDTEVFERWLRPVKLTSYEQGEAVIEVPNKFFRDRIARDYHQQVKAAIANVTGEEVHVTLDIAEVEPELPWSKSPGTQEVQAQVSSSDRMNPRYSFSNFVVGDNNRLAHAAALAVAQSPAKAYNPLFIYGGVGLGKTHLMQAVGSQTMQNNNRLKVIYIASEKFTNQMILAIKNNRTSEFRETYRTADVLLLDDIHFIAGKDRTQEEMFHTFNALYDARKQIVMASDRAPKEIPDLQERLVSRFEWGLLADIQSPDFETRVAILKHKAQNETVEVPDEVAYFIADKITANVRELEGALIRVVASASLLEKPVTMDLATEVLQKLDFKEEEERKLTVGSIQEAVARHFAIKMHDMVTKKRSKSVAYPRQIAMYLSRSLTDFSLPEIGQHFGGRDHTTVIYACNKIEKQLRCNKTTKRQIEQLTKDIKG